MDPQIYEMECDECHASFNINLEEFDDRYTPKYCVFCRAEIQEDSVLWINNIDESSFNYLPNDE